MTQLKNMNVRLLKIFQVMISVALVAHLLKQLKWESIEQLGTALSSPMLILPPICILVGLGFAAWRWRILLQHFKHQFSFAECYKLYGLGLFFNVVLPGAIGGDLIRITKTKQAGLSLTKSSLIVLSERVAGLFSVFILGSAFSFWIYTQVQHNILEAIVWPIWFITIGMLFSIFFALIIFRYAASKNYLARCPAFLVSIIEKITEIAQLPPKKLMLVLTFSIVFQTSDVLASVTLAHILGMDLSPSLLFVINPAVFVATVLPLSLGGLGVREGTMAHLLAFFGFGLEQAILLAFLIHVNRIIIGLIGGSFYFLSKEGAKSK